jgi:DNA-binding NarL/FixJ family response regulator
VIRARILIADDHKEMRDKIVQHLETEFDIVDAVGTGREVLESVARMQPEICVLDISMPIVNGIEAAERMKACNPSTRVVFLTVHQDQDFVDVALKVGALERLRGKSQNVPRFSTSVARGHGRPHFCIAPIVGLTLRKGSIACAGA